MLLNMNNMDIESMARLLKMLGSIDDRSLLKLKVIADEANDTNMVGNNRLDIVVHNSNEVPVAKSVAPVVEKKDDSAKLADMMNKFADMMKDMVAKVSSNNNSEIADKLDELTDRVDDVNSSVELSSSNSDAYDNLMADYRQLQNKMHEVEDAKAAAENKLEAAKVEIGHMGDTISEKDAKIDELKEHDGSAELEKKLNEFEARNEELRKDMADKDDALKEAEANKKLIVAYHDFVLALFKLLPADGVTIVRNMDTIKALPDDVKSAQFGGDDVRFDVKRADDKVTVDEKKNSDVADIVSEVNNIGDDTLNRLVDHQMGATNGGSKSDEESQVESQEDSEEAPEEASQASEMNGEGIDMEHNQEF